MAVSVGERSVRCGQEIRVRLQTYSTDASCLGGEHRRYSFKQRSRERTLSCPEGCRG